MLDYIISWQEFFDKLSTYSIVYYPVHFILSSFVSYFSFKVLLPGVKTFDELLQHILTLSRQEEKIKQEIKKFTLQYAVVTGLASCAIIAFQFKGLSINSAIIYGVLGAYFLKDQMLRPISKEIVKEFNKQVASHIAETKTEIEQDYKSELDKISKDVLKDTAEFE